MPRSPTSVQTYNRRYEAKRRRSYSRGPRITLEAAERLRTLAYELRLNPCDVVSLLILATHPDRERMARFEYQKRERLSDSEMSALDALGVTFLEPVEPPSPAATGTTCNERTTP